MSGSSWKQDLTSCCLYVYGDELKTISAEDLANVDGVSAAIPVPDPADSKGGDRFLVLFNNQIEVRRCGEKKSIICNDTELKVEDYDTTCDIPDDWETFMGVPSQTALQYPSNEAEDQTDLYANVPSRQEQGNVYNMPPMDSKLCRDSGGQQLPIPQGQQNPMILGQHPFPMMPPFMFPQEGATAHENLPAGGQFWTPQQQLWMQQQMQMFLMQQGRMPEPTAPPLYAASEEKSGTGETPEPEARPQLRISELSQLDDREAANHDYDEDTAQGDKEPEARSQLRISEPSQLDDREAANHDYDEDTAQGDKDIAMIKVTNIPPDTSEDSLFFFFENRRKSGGGSIKEIEYDPDTQSAVITFEDPEVIENILGKKHKIDGTSIEVFRYVPPPPPKPVPMYPNKVFIKNLSEKTTKDGLVNFLEVKTSLTPISIEYGEIEGTALVTFDEILDFEKLQLACKKRSLDKSQLKVCKVPVTNCVIVRNVSEKTSQDTLEFYFDNERRSGVTGVLDVKMCDGFCLVYFEEPEAIDVVCVKSHRVDGQILEVKIYYECLGQVESEEDGPFQPPGPLELTDLDTKKMQFLMKSPPNRETVQKQLEAVYGKPVWPKKSTVDSLSVECTLTAQTKDCRKISRTWEAKVKEYMNMFLDLLVVTKHSTLKEAFPILLNELKSLTISNPDAVAVVLEKSNHEIYVTGHKQASTEVSKQLSEIIQKVEAKLDKKNQQIQEEIKLKRHQVLILQSCKFEQNIQKKYKDISLKYDLWKNCIRIEGLSGEVTAAIIEMFEFVIKVVKTEVGGISKLLQSFLQNQPVYKYVNGKMREKDVVGVWEFNKEDESLTVFSLSDQQAVQAAHLLKESVIETPINVKEESRPLLKSGEWQSKSSKIEQQAEGLIKIVTHTTQIIILCTDKWEGLSREYIEDFLETNTVYEETLTIEPGMMRYIQMNCAEAIDKVDKDLQQERGAAKISDTGIMIRGTQTGLNKCKFAIGKIVHSVEKQSHTINKPGIRKHMESQQGREKLRTVERSQRVVIEVSDDSVSDEDNDGSFLKAGAKKRELAVCMSSVERKISALAFTTEERKQGGGVGCHERPFGTSSHSRPTPTPRGKGKSDILDNARRNPSIVEGPRSVTLVIYGKTPEQIKKAIQTIDGGIDSLFRSKVFNESIIKQFSSSQENKIKQLKETYDVDVTVEPRIGRIVMHGLIEDVMNAADKVHEVIRKADAARQEKQAAEIMADMVEWCFIDITPKGQELEKYPPEINMKLEKALRNQDSKVSFTDKDGKRYIVDLTNYEEYPEDDKMDVVKVIRKNKIDKSGFEPPVTWSAMDAKDNVAVVTLVPRCEEYKKVAQNFIAGTGSAYSIVKIERIQNRFLLQQYEAKFKLMEKQNPTGTTNERMLWHGTGSDAVDSIYTYGFHRSYCRKNAVVHGDGVYFAVNANYSARDTYSPRDVNNNKRMYQCRVLTGEFCQSKQGMTVPPNKPGSQHILYDSAVDTPRNPGIFVIFNDTQAYPEYLITFQFPSFFLM